MNDMMHKILTENGYVLSHELATCTTYVKVSTNCTVNIQDNRVLINGDSEHTIDTHTLDAYDTAMVLHLLGVVDLGMLEDVDVPKKKLTHGLPGASDRKLMEVFFGSTCYDIDMKQQLQINAMTG